MLRLSLEFNPIAANQSSTSLLAPAAGLRPRTETIAMRSSDDVGSAFGEFKTTDEFNAAFDHFIESLDLSASKSANFSKVLS